MPGARIQDLPYVYRPDASRVAGQPASANMGSIVIRPRRVRLGVARGSPFNAGASSLFAVRVLRPVDRELLRLPRREARVPSLCSGGGGVYAGAGKISIVRELSCAAHGRFW
jgi:hypothetical protein